MPDLSGELLSLDIAGILYIEVYGHKSSASIWPPARAESSESRSISWSSIPSSIFARFHQSYLVNMSCILSIARCQLTLSTGLTLPISQSKCLNLQNGFILYTKQQKLWL